MLKVIYEIVQSTFQTKENRLWEPVNGFDLLPPVRFICRGRAAQRRWNTGRTWWVVLALPWPSGMLSRPERRPHLPSPRPPPPSTPPHFSTPATTPPPAQNLILCTYLPPSNPLSCCEGHLCPALPVLSHRSHLSLQLLFVLVLVPN